MLQTIVFLLTLLGIRVFAFHPSYPISRGTCRQRQIHFLAPQQLGEFEPINTSNEDRALRRVWLYDYVTAPDSSTVAYHMMWDHQKTLVDHQLSRIGKGPKDPPLYGQFIPVDSASIDSQATIGCDSIIMVEHDPVYTLGTASDASFIKGYHAFDENREEVTIADDDHDSIPIVRIERGGEVTYHGPGQLVVYPIIDLRGYNQDIHWYMRALEEVIILALEKAGIEGVSVYQSQR
jgi:lipoate-protein ligase B